MYTIAKRFAFSASHTIGGVPPEHPCARLHGHNYEVEVTVKGEIDQATGCVVNLSDLDTLVVEQVVAPFDHRNLNEEIVEFRRLVPTTENLGVVIDRRLREAWPRVFPGAAPKLERVRILETPRNIFEI